MALFIQRKYPLPKHRNSRSSSTKLVYSSFNFMSSNALTHSCYCVHPFSFPVLGYHHPHTFQRIYRQLTPTRFDSDCYTVHLARQETLGKFTVHQKVLAGRNWIRGAWRMNPRLQEMAYCYICGHLFSCFFG